MAPWPELSKYIHNIQYTIYNNICFVIMPGNIQYITIYNNSWYNIQYITILDFIKKSFLFFVKKDLSSAPWLQKSWHKHLFHIFFFMKKDSLWRRTFHPRLDFRGVDTNTSFIRVWLWPLLRRLFHNPASVGLFCSLTGLFWPLLRRLFHNPVSVALLCSLIGLFWHVSTHPLRYARVSRSLVLPNRSLLTRVHASTTVCPRQ